MQCWRGMGLWPMSSTVDRKKHVIPLWAADGAGHYTKHESMYFRFLHKLLPQFEGGSVLEVGPGTGLFAKMMMDRYPITEYTILDLESQIGDSQETLVGYDCEFVLSQEYKQLFNRPFDLFVSNVCLPETPDYYRAALCDGVFPACQFAFVIGGDPKSGGAYNQWIRQSFKEQFAVVAEKSTGYCKTFAISGRGAI